MRIDRRDRFIWVFPRFALRNRRWNYWSPFRIRFIKQYFLTLRDPFAAPARCHPPSHSRPWILEFNGKLLENPADYSFTFAQRRVHLCHISCSPVCSGQKRAFISQFITDASFLFAFSNSLSNPHGTKSQKLVWS